LREDKQAACPATIDGTCSAKPAGATGVERTAAAYRADPDEVRAELRRLLAQARAAQSFPWDARRTLYWRTIFLQMTNWLPDEEAA
jgi:hypothetical protein